jgi:predicted ATPase/class 3 adenylate cyclase
MSVPSGVVTFVFSDIEGSTRLWEIDPSGMERSLSRHDEIARATIQRAGGFLFKHTGDGFGAAFGSVSAALSAASDVAAALAEEHWEGPALSCRMGVHSGEAEPRDGDYFGSTVTRTARIMDAGNGGQILVSEATRRLVGERPPPGMEFVDAGEHRLKDLGEPVKLNRLVGHGANDPRQLRTLERAPHNLPIQLSSFVGRQGQIKELADLVRQSRLVTLSGIGGVGKTRLSLQVAADVLSDFTDGAWFVELAPLAEAGLLADTVANALSIPQDSTASAERRLFKFLAERRALVVIDNCEHLIDDVASFVDSLLRACPEVHVLATSREGLSVMGEVLWRVPSLRVDDDAAAVELFADRARLVQPTFSITNENLSTVADLCVRLDGIPLAIELATARLKMLTVEQVAQHLNDRFRLLTGGSRTAVERQRTLRAMMNWSYDLLSDHEQALLRRLSVFYDGFTYEAAEEVCSGELLPRFEVLDLLGRLVEASVVTFETDLRRYRLLETVRQYALDKLFEADEADEARLRHAEFFLTISRSVRDGLDRDDFTFMNVGNDELGNNRAAMTWALESGRGELALELACNLRMYFWNRVMYRESTKWLTSALDLVEDGASPYVPIGAAFALTDATNLSDIALIARLLPRVQRLFESEVSDDGRGALANALASHTMATDVRRADELYREAHKLLRAAGSVRWASAVQNRFLTAFFMDSDEHRQEVLSLVDEALAEGVSIHESAVRIAFMCIAEEYEQLLEYTKTRDPVDDWEDAMFSLFKAQAQRATGRFDDAMTSIQRAAAVLGPNAPGAAEWQTAMLCLQKGLVDEAVAALQVPTAELQVQPECYERIRFCAAWLIIAERRMDFTATATLAGHIDSLKTSAHVRLPAFDQRTVSASIDVAREALGDEVFEDHRQKGLEMGWEDVALAYG